MENLNNKQPSVNDQGDEIVEEFRDLCVKKCIEHSPEEAVRALLAESHEAVDEIIRRQVAEKLFRLHKPKDEENREFSEPGDIPFIELPDPKEPATITENDRVVFQSNLSLQAFVRPVFPAELPPGKFEEFSKTSERLLRVVFRPFNSHWRSFVFKRPAAERPEDSCAFLKTELLDVMIRERTHIVIQTSNPLPESGSANLNHYYE